MAHKERGGKPTLQLNEPTQMNIKVSCFDREEIVVIGSLLKSALTLLKKNFLFIYAW